MQVAVSSPSNRAVQPGGDEPSVLVLCLTVWTSPVSPLLLRLLASRRSSTVPSSTRRVHGAVRADAVQTSSKSAPCLPQEAFPLAVSPRTIRDPACRALSDPKLLPRLLPRATQRPIDFVSRYRYEVLQPLTAGLFYEIAACPGFPNPNPTRSASSSLFPPHAFVHASFPCLTSLVGKHSSSSSIFFFIPI